MVNNDKDDKELNDYLDGNSDLSNAYRTSNNAEPSTHLDEKIISAAKNVIENNKQKTKPKFHKAPWVKPVSIAALITLSVSLVVTMQQETGKPIISEPEVEMYDSAVIVKDSKTEETTHSSDVATSINELELKQNEDGRADSPAPASLGSSAELYRAEEKAEAPNARMEVDAAKRMLSKEKVQQDTLEERDSIEEVVPSTPTGVEFDDAMHMEQARAFSLQKEALLKIKSLFEQGQLEQAKDRLKLFRDIYPDFSEEEIKVVIGEELFKTINDN